MKKKYYDLKLKISYLIRGIRSRKTLHLMDIVTYRGKEYFVNNGTGRPLWDLVENVSFDKNGKRKSVVAHEDEIKKIMCWKNFKRGIFSVYDFNMLYWHKINLRQLLER